MKDYFGIIIGLLLKIKYVIYFIFKIKPPKLSNDGPVVSLTSYGRRLKVIVPYTIYSIFEQKKKASRIVLWVNKNEFNKGNLPWRLKYLQKYGLEVRYVEDIRSYTKLIYALEEIHDKAIITVDDDLAYSKHLVGVLMSMHNKYPNCVCALRCNEPQWDVPYESFIPYRKWQHKKNNESLPHMALGYGGVLYPPCCFDDEVFNKEIYTKYCPFADDVWFWAMEIKNGTPVVIADKEMSVFSLDIFYQYFHEKSALSQINVDRDKNDEQIKAIMDLYNLWAVLRNKKL